MRWTTAKKRPPRSSHEHQKANSSRERSRLSADNDKAEGKDTHRTEVGKKLPAGQVQKLPAGRCKKLPSYYIPGEPCPLVGRWAGKRTCWQTVSETDAEVLAMRAPSSRRVSLIVVVSAGELAERLRREGQDEWCTRVRLGGLLLLIDFLCRNHTVGGFPLPADLADGFISKLGKPKSRRTMREPLAVLCHVGILRRVRAAVNGWHLRTPALYALGREYVKRRVTQDVDLPLYLARKRELAFVRRETRRNRRYPFRARLLTDLKKLSFDPSSRRLIAELLGHPDFGPSAKRAIEAVDGIKHWLRVSPRQQVTTSVTGCPRELKRLLLIGGEPVVSCDIAHAHHCFLPALIGARISYFREKHGSGADVCRYKAELEQLIEFLGDGDYYSKWCRG